MSMYTVRKLGALWQVVTSANVVQFSSLERANCTRWVTSAEETQAQKESRYCKR